MTTTKNTETISVTTCTISGRELVALLKSTGHLPEAVSPEVTVKVPGGGDWSNMSLDIDDDCPIILRFTERRSIS